MTDQKNQGNQRNQRNQETDPGLQENERIEAAIAGLQQEASPERLAHTLTVIRQRMREGGQFIIAVEPPKGDDQLRIQAVRTENGQSWWTVFSSFEEELKGSDSVKSTFLTDIGQLFTQAVQTEEIQGIILNPWNRTLMLDKALIQVILGQKK
ncbi:SseB family protein [Jutongia huaianensis]|uniref:SseB family protein n=1 Tax=Jutongia huaianensis TaxID=2763668 RepID=A0ABR7N086_9FIRM|nr:SseB family protein [Jutongia huaianensis]MBC8562015.1 SseB family protein [Jutongia huaianensis]